MATAFLVNACGDAVTIVGVPRYPDPSAWLRLSPGQRRLLLELLGGAPRRV